MEAEIPCWCELTRTTRSKTALRLPNDFQLSSAFFDWIGGRKKKGCLVHNSQLLLNFEQNSSPDCWITLSVASSSLLPCFTLSPSAKRPARSCWATACPWLSEPVSSTWTLCRYIVALLDLDSTYIAGCVETTTLYHCSLTNQPIVNHPKWTWYVFIMRVGLVRSGVVMKKLLTVLSPPKLLVLSKITNNEQITKTKKWVL